MPRLKRRRLLTPLRKKSGHHKFKIIDYEIESVLTPRGRLKGALLEALDPAAGEESDTSIDHTPVKRERRPAENKKKEERDSSDEEHTPLRGPHRQSYVLKLFDRSVDLSQFEEDSPLYPICRAWIANQPKADYTRFGKKYEEPAATNDSVDLPGPEGPMISRIPSLLPEQQQRNKDNINLNYREAVPPGRDELLQAHLSRWTDIRKAWLDQANRVESRYEATQQLLNKINVNAI